MKCLAELGVGDLAAFFYSTRQQQLAFAIPYIVTGIQNNERCIYITQDASVPLILNKLERHGIDLKKVTHSGQLNVLTKHETYLRDGEFHPLAMAEELHLEVRSSLAKGFSGLRGSGDMGWVLEIPDGIKKLIEYQTILARNFPPNFLAVCQYDETKFPREILNAMIELHPVRVRDDQVERLPVAFNGPPLKPRDAAGSTA